MTRICIPAGGWRPRWYQQDLMAYLDAGGKRAVEVWSRRAGKDMCCVHQTVKMALQRTGLYVHTLPNHRQARKALWDNIDSDGKPLLQTAFPDGVVARRHNEEMKITLKNGSIWQLVGADYYNSVVGANAVGLVMSEAALTDPGAWGYFRPMIAANDGAAVFISTPRGKNWFYKLAQMARADSSWHYALLGADRLGHISPGILASERLEMERMGQGALFAQEYLCDFNAADVGAIFGRWIGDADREGRITDDIDPISPHDNIMVSCDIGWRDKAVFWWWRRLYGGRAELIDYEEASGLDAEEWCDRLRSKPRAGTLYLPHDARAKTFQSRRTVVETFAQADVADRILVIPQSKKADQINAARRVLPMVRFDEAKCEQGIESLRAYHYRWDDRQKILSADPEHDWSSHASDAFMYGAQVLADAPERPKPAPRDVGVPADRAYNLESLWDTVGTGSGRI